MLTAKHLLSFVLALLLGAAVMGCACKIKMPPEKDERTTELLAKFKADLNKIDASGDIEADYKRIHKVHFPELNDCHVTLYMLLEHARCLMNEKRTFEAGQEAARHALDISNKCQNAMSLTRPFEDQLTLDEIRGIEGSDLSETTQSRMFKTLEQAGLARP